MANDLQEITAPSDLRPLVTRYQSPEERLETSEPFAQLIHTQDAVSLDGSTGTDTFNISLTLPLPQNYAYKLERAQVVITAPTQNVWGDQDAGMYIYAASSPAVASGATTELFLSMHKTIVEDLGNVQRGGTWNYASAGGTIASGFGSIASSMSCPFLFGYPDVGVYPRFALGDSNTDVNTDLVMSYWFTWLVYQLEQVNHAAVHWPTTITPSG